VVLGVEVAIALPEYSQAGHGYVKTVVLRVNSPGGSTTTSEVIQREVRSETSCGFDG